MVSGNQVGPPHSVGEGARNTRDAGRRATGAPFMQQDAEDLLQRLEKSIEAASDKRKSRLP